MSAHPHSSLPVPVPERRALVAAAVAFATGIAVLVYALALAGGGPARDRVIHAPAPVVKPGTRAATTPAATTPAATTPAAAAAVPVTHTAARAISRAVPMLTDATHISSAWAAGFYPIYAEAARTFGVTWLLVASVHKQESAFSTAPTTYHGVNFARCCAGPMQFNVTNGPQTTWQRFSGAYRLGHRPSSYNHASAKHPSVYDDFDSIMAGASLLRASGAGAALDGTAWQAAYDYYGHDATGVAYADEVLARAWGWRAHGFCVNCGVEPSLIARAYADYGSYAMSKLAPPPMTKRSRHVRKTHVVADQHHRVADHLHQP